jgi:hypothetical protein
VPAQSSSSIPVPRITNTGFWDFTAQATNLGSCHSKIGNNAGTLWGTVPVSSDSKYTQINVCVASDNATPYFADWLVNGRTFIEVIFTTFTNKLNKGKFCPDSLDAATVCGFK